jgi:hypothetical protein
VQKRVLSHVLVGNGWRPARRRDGARQRVEHRHRIVVCVDAAVAREEDTDFCLLLLLLLLLYFTVTVG